MRKLVLALVAGCMSAAFAGAYAATGSPADSDKAGRMGPGTAAGQMGAVDPNKTGASSTKGGSSMGSSTGAASSTGAGSSAASSTNGAGSSATAGTGGSDQSKGRRSRRARASKG